MKAFLYIRKFVCGKHFSCSSQKIWVPNSLSYEDFLNWTLTTLKDYLGIRGLKQTGRKAELVARAFGAYELNAPKKLTREKISENIKKEYNERLEINKILIK